MFQPELNGLLRCGGMRRKSSASGIRDAGILSPKRRTGKRPAYRAAPMGAMRSTGFVAPLCVDGAINSELFASSGNVCSRNRVAKAWTYPASLEMCRVARHSNVTVSEWCRQGNVGTS
jgi:hypothetical protein